MSGQLLVGRGDYLVLGVSQNQSYGSADYNGNVPVDVLYDYGSDPNTFNIDFDDEDFVVTYGSLVLDEVDTDSSWGGLPDVSRQVDVYAPGLEWANDYSVNWCSSSTFLADSGMRGTPGAANEACGASDMDSDGDGYTAAEGDCRDDDPSVNPGAVDGNDGIPEAGGGGNADDDANCNGLRDDGVLDGDGVCPN